MNSGTADWISGPNTRSSRLGRSAKVVIVSLPDSIASTGACVAPVLLTGISRSLSGHSIQDRSLGCITQRQACPAGEMDVYPTQVGHGSNRLGLAALATSPRRQQPPDGSMHSSGTRGAAD